MSPKLFSWLAALALFLPGLQTLSGADTATNAVGHARTYFHNDAEFYRQTGTYVSEVISQQGLTEKQATVLRTYQEINKAAITEESMAKLYQSATKEAGNAHDAFKVVAKLIADGKISNEHSIQMAKLRDKMIDQVLLKIGQDNKWRIARSDSGNQSSGMKSDLDQTFYVFKFDPNEGKWVRQPELDKDLIEQFKKEWARGPPTSEISLEAVDVASIEGRNRFPDPREVKVEHFAPEFERVIRELRNTPGAYTTAGAVAQQMQFRAFTEIMADNPRAFRIYGADDLNGKWAKFPPDEYDKIPKEKRKEWFAEHNSTWHEKAVRTMFGNEPQLMKGYAFGAALANFQEMQKYMHGDKFEVKYHLRTWEDAMQVLYLAEQAEKTGVARSEKKEYADLPEARRKELNDIFLTKLFGDDAVKKQRHALALEISAQQRILHKGKTPPGFWWVKGNSTKEKQKLFTPLGEALGKIDGQPFDPKNPDHIAAADKEYRKICSEFSGEAAFHCSADAFELIMNEEGSKKFVESYNHLMKQHGKEVLTEEVEIRLRKNLAEAARLTLTYALYDLNKMAEERATKLLDMLRKRFPEQGHLVQQLVDGAERLKNDPGAALPDFHPEDTEVAKEGKITYRDLMERHWGTLRESVRDHIYSELGFERGREAKAVDAILTKQELVWNWRKLTSDKLKDPGTYDSLTQVLLTAVESDLDVEAIAKTATRELFFNLPVAGQLASVAQGAAEDGARGAVQSVSLLGLGMYYPVVGQIMVGYSIGSAGYEIYKLEVEAPQRSNLDDAMYRGFSGPELRDFGDVPPQFTDDDEKQLRDMESQLKEAERRWRMAQQKYGDRDPDVPYAPEASEIGAAHMELEVLAKDLTPKIEALTRKQAMWKQYRDDRSVWAWQGGRFLGMLSAAAGGSGVGPGAQLTQKPFTNYLLRDIEPLYAFLPQKEGVVDLTVLKTYDPNTAPAKMEELRKKATDEHADIRVRFKADAEYHELAVVQSNRYVRATNYLAAIERMPELKYRFKRDSIYPWLLKANIPSVQKFANDWVVANGEVVTMEAISNKLTDIKLPAPVSEDALLPSVTVPPPNVALEAAERLTDRMLADMNRSRDLWVEYTVREKARLRKSLDENVEDSVRNFEAQAAGALAINQQHSDSYRAFLDAMRVACIRPNPPRLRATINLTPSDTEVRLSGSQGVAERKYKVSVESSLTVNPIFYPGDPANKGAYSNMVHYIGEAEARTAIASRSIKGLPLLPGTVAGIQHVLTNVTFDAKTDELLVAVVSAFSKEIPQIPDVVPGVRAAVADLPGYNNREQVEGVGHLMAQAIAYAILPKGASGEFSGEVQSHASYVKVWIVVTDKSSNPPRVSKSEGMVILGGKTKQEAFAKKLAEEQKKRPYQEVTLEEKN